MKPGGVLVVGLDGGTLDIVGPMTRRGLMPTFEGLIHQGRAGILRSTVPWYTVPGWTSLMTGVGPGTHGLLYWVASGDDEYFENWRPGRRFLTSADITYPTFWDIAGAAGKRVVVINMPLTYPAWPVNGCMITGLLTPRAAETGVCYPADLLSRFPGYQVDLSVSRAAGSPEAPGVENFDLPSYLRELIELTEGRAQVGKVLLADDVDLGVVVFVGPDRISHKAWTEQSSVANGGAGSGDIERLIEGYYRALDRAVSDLVEACGPDVTVMMVADHGFGPPPARTFVVNEWLREAGYLKLHADRAQRVVRSSARLKRMVRPLVRRLKRQRGRRSERWLVNWSQSSAYGVGYSRTPVFGLVVNRQGLKQEGSVPSEEVPGIVRRLQADLESLADERGRPVVRRVWTREELGATRRAFPDLLVETDPEFLPWDGLTGSGLFAPFREQTGIHARDGIFVLAGSRVRGQGEAQADIVDVAPTVLGLLGIAAPPQLEGRPREDLVEFPERAVAPQDVSSPAVHVPDVTIEQQEEIEAHLRTLGYTE